MNQSRDVFKKIETTTGFEPVLGGKLAEKAIWVDEARCIGCRYCAHVATNTFIVDEEYGRSKNGLGFNGDARFL